MPMLSPRSNRLVAFHSGLPELAMKHPTKHIQSRFVLSLPKLGSRRLHFLVATVAAAVIVVSAAHCCFRYV